MGGVYQKQPNVTVTVYMIQCLDLIKCFLSSIGCHAEMDVVCFEYN